MKRIGFLLAVLVMSLFSVMSASAEVDGIYDIYWNQDTGDYQKAWWYNHDNSVCKGPEYLERILELKALGYKYRGYAITEYSGGSGPTHGSYEEDYFVKTKLDKIFEDGIGILFRTTPEGLQYNDPVQGWIDVPEEMEVPVQVEELLLEGTFDHDAYQQTGQHWVQIWGPFGFWAPDFGWVDTGSDTNIPIITIINDDGTEAVWTIIDVYGTSVAAMVIHGEEEWDTKTVFFELPQTGTGAPQIPVKNWGNIIVKDPESGFPKYGPDTIDVYSEEAKEYIKWNGKNWVTYENSPADLEYKEYCKKSHAITFDEDTKGDEDGDDLEYTILDWIPPSR